MFLLPNSFWGEFSWNVLKNKNFMYMCTPCLCTLPAKLQSCICIFTSIARSRLHSFFWIDPREEQIQVQIMNILVIAIFLAIGPLRIHHLIYRGRQNKNFECFIHINTINLFYLTLLRKLTFLCSINYHTWDLRSLWKFI